MLLNMPVDLIGKLVEKKKKTEGPLISPRVPVIVMDVPDSGLPTRQVYEMVI